MSIAPNRKLFLTEARNLSRFTVHFFKQCFKPRYEIAELLRQCFVIGYKSLPLVALTAFIMGSADICDFEMEGGKIIRQ